MYHNNSCGCNGSNNTSGFSQDYIWIILIVVVLLFGFGGFNTNNSCGCNDSCDNFNPCC